MAFDAQTGRQLWEQPQRLAGTWLGYSETHDLLLQAGASGQRPSQGRSPATAWPPIAGQTARSHGPTTLKYTGPCILHHDLVITTPDSYKRIRRRVQSARWHAASAHQPAHRPIWSRGRSPATYGCNYPVASEHLLTFRSGAAGFYDLETKGGTGNFGGFKSGCSANLIAANGVLNAPDYTRTCSCPYQNQTSLALIHMPEMEMWTSTLFGTGVKTHDAPAGSASTSAPPATAARIPARSGMEHPSIGGTSANVEVVLTGKGTNYFRRTPRK